MMIKINYIASFRNRYPTAPIVNKIDRDTFGLKIFEEIQNMNSKEKEKEKEKIIVNDVHLYEYPEKYHVEIVFSLEEARSCRINLEENGENKEKNQDPSNFSPFHSGGPFYENSPFHKKSFVEIVVGGNFNSFLDIIQVGLIKNKSHCSCSENSCKCRIAEVKFVLNEEKVKKRWMREGCPKNWFLFN